MITKKFFIVAVVLLISSSSFCQKMEYTLNEQNEIKLFEDFKNYIITGISQNIDFTDSTQIKYILTHFLFINFKLEPANKSEIDLHQIPEEKLNILKRGVNDFYNFFVNNKNINLAGNITAIPIRNSKDTFVFNKFTKFQKDNTLVMYDKRFPEKTLCYMLFVPPTKDINPASRIWSWSLGFKFGKFYFTSFSGDEGYEYMFGED